jgi:toxin ParE1/3/4
MLDAVADCSTSENWPRCSFTADELHGTRRMPVAGFAKHLIFYQSSERKILVLRVVHGARDLESLFSE